MNLEVQSTDDITIKRCAPSIIPHMHSLGKKEKSMKLRLDAQFSKGVPVAIKSQTSKEMFWVVIFQPFPFHFLNQGNLVWISKQLYVSDRHNTLDCRILWTSHPSS